MLIGSGRSVHLLIARFATKVSLDACCVLRLPKNKLVSLVARLHEVLAQRRLSQKLQRAAVSMDDLDRDRLSLNKRVLEGLDDFAPIERGHHAVCDLLAGQNLLRVAQSFAWVRKSLQTFFCLPKELLLFNLRRSISDF